MLTLIILRPGWSHIMVSFLALAGFTVFFLARRTNLIRDSVPPDPPAGEMRPYSLGKFQMAVWSFIILGSFLLVYAITGEYNTVITNQALILMGIGVGTAIGSSSIDHSKQDAIYQKLRELGPRHAGLVAEVDGLRLRLASGVSDLSERSRLNADLARNDVERAEVEAELVRTQGSLSQPVSEGFMKDLITDAHGVGLHRFQMLIWTIVFALIFMDGVDTNLAMPELDNTLLALIGISSGTYLGFKIPERQVEGT